MTIRCSSTDASSGSASAAHATSAAAGSHAASFGPVVEPVTQSQRSPVIKPQTINTSPTSPNSVTSHEPFHKPTSAVAKRTSFIENSNVRSNNRAQRTHSFSADTYADVLMKKTNEEHSGFSGRDWCDIPVAEIVDLDETRFVELKTSIEDTTKLLVRSGAPNVVLVRESTRTRTAIGTFDYSDLNTYLLLVLGVSEPDEQAAKIAERTRNHEVIPLSDVIDHLGPREVPVFLPYNATLAQAMEALGGGHHRLVLTKEGSTEAVAVLSQLRLVSFFWANRHSFPATEKLYSKTLKELKMGAKVVVAVNGDKPLPDALRLMHDEGITSLPVLDSQNNVVGNISHVDTRLLTDTSAFRHLKGSCIHFISAILTERGIEDGKDSYPVFYVNPYSTLAHAVAKLCATRSHRMWIVESPSPSNSIPPSPGLHHALPSLSTHSGNTATSSTTALPPPYHSTPASVPHRHSMSHEVTPGSPHLSTHPGISAPASNFPTSSVSGSGGISGRLSGVVSLTDVLNVFARASGLKPSDPEEMRRRRRQSSSGSNVRRSVDGVRASGEFLRGSNTSGVVRSPSTSSAGRGRPVR